MNRRRPDKLRDSASLNFGLAESDAIEALLTPVTDIALT